MCIIAEILNTIGMNTTEQQQKNCGALHHIFAELRTNSRRH